MAHPYCTSAAVKAQLPHLDGEWGLGAVPDNDHVEEIIEEHDQLIDSYLTVRFVVPFDTVPDAVSQISRDLTVSKVRALIFSDSPDPDRVGPELRKQAMQYLSDIASGKAALDPQGAAQADTTAGDDRRPVGSWPSTTEATFSLEDEW